MKIQLILPWCLCVDVLPCEQWSGCGIWQWLVGLLEESEALPVSWEHEEADDDKDSWSGILDFAIGENVI
jgi:hypothetical protein